MNLISQFKKLHLINLELTLLFLMLLSLPSLEAPKNIFLVLFVVTAIIRQVKTKSLMVWSHWDWMFLAIVTTAFLSTIFAGLAPGDEWKGFRVLLTFISVGWLISRSKYSSKQLGWIFWLTIISALPPLCWGLVQYLVLHTKSSLELHSVGHVNHSAIYLTMIFGATFGLLLSFLKDSNTIKKNSFILLTIIFFMALLIGASRAAVGIAIILAILFLFMFVKSLRLKLIFISFLTLLTLPTFFLSSGVMERQLQLQSTNQSLNGRAEIWHTTIEAARLYPLFGIGIDNRALVSEDLIKKSVESRHEIFNKDYYNFKFKHSHSFYLTNIAERGILGFMVTLCFILMWLQSLTKSYSQAKLDNQSAYLWMGSMSAWLATFGIGFVNTTFHHEHGILACLFLGLHISYLNTHRIKLKRKS
jgi:O-antigen ligase